MTGASDTDELLRVDRVVREGLGVPSGTTIREHARAPRVPEGGRMTDTEADTARLAYKPIDPDLKAEGWIGIGEGHHMWLHLPSHRCLVIDASPRGESRIPCWGPEPADPKTPGFFVACRVHEESGEPLFGDCFWVESYETALRLARRIRATILNEKPSDQVANRAEFERRKDEAHAEFRKLVDMNRYILDFKEQDAPPAPVPGA